MSCNSGTSSKASKDTGGMTPSSKKGTPKADKAAKDLSPQAIEERRSAAARGELCVVHPPPPMQADLINFGDALFAKLLRGSARSIQPCPEMQSETGRKGGRGSQSGRASPTQAEADKFVPPVHTRDRASCCLESEREALAKDLNVC